MTANQEEHLRWKSRQVGGDDLKEVFALVDELREIAKHNRCSYAKDGYGCRLGGGHYGDHDFTPRRPNRC